MKIKAFYLAASCILLSACGQRTPEESIQKIEKDCNSELKKQAGDKYDDSAIAEYCSCVSDVTKANFSDEEIVEMAKAQNDKNEILAQELVDLSQNCIEEFQAKAK